jgi:hypothetical protein
LHFQVSGLYFYADNGYSTTYPGVDVRLIGSTLGRLNSDGTLIPRNSFKNDPTKRVDARIQRHFKLGHKMSADVLLEGFNLFNSATYSYTLNQAVGASARSRPTTKSRTLQLGFRFAY